MSEKQFTVFVPSGNGYSNPNAISRVVDHFKALRLTADFVQENGLAKQDKDGTYTLVTKDERAEVLAPRLLDVHYGLIVIPGIEPT